MTLRVSAGHDPDYPLRSARTAVGYYLQDGKEPPGPWADWVNGEDRRVRVLGKWLTCARMVAAAPQLRVEQIERGSWYLGAGRCSRARA